MIMYPNNFKYFILLQILFGFILYDQLQLNYIGRNYWEHNVGHFKVMQYQSVTLKKCLSGFLDNR